MIQITSPIQRSVWYVSPPTILELSNGIYWSNYWMKIAKLLVELSKVLNGCFSRNLLFMLNFLKKNNFFIVSLS